MNVNWVALGSTSTATSSPMFVADYRLLTVSFESKASLGASRFTIEASNADGLQNTDNFTTSGSLSTGWSVLTGVNMVGRTPGTIEVTPGARWLRVTVPVATQSAASYTTVIVRGVRF